MFPHADELNYFIEVAKTKNISRAAERLGIRQPSLSAAIKRLERQLGTEVIIREKTGVQLSRAGLRLLKSAQQLLDDWDEVKYSALRENKEVVGHFTIGCHSSISLHMLPNSLPSFIAQNPGIELSFQHALSREIVEAVISWKIDIGIVVNPVSHPDLVIKHLCHDVVSFWHNPKKIQSKDVLIYDPGLMQTDWLLKAVGHSNKYKQYITSSSHELITNMTLEGLEWVLSLGVLLKCLEKAN
ncbi:LysR family transcriptional regulator [Microbulbifer sp. GL-2]|uniref:LysR family transcriptional regulator n=1 Tax=Microbulbifer sp. GL-2 TaxID=2591606 RepID=UPI001162F8A2|nr:LysR family transcriptional regulator [Microbulbifer sp. GL-2]BBM03587.1 LysR family transcriptional regulator [Microbulbifer sp. GL-2]